ncbi:MAG: aspartate kinase [Spirochaetales bacterium]|nr:aspartate kinase [Spirochaetales bacterium]
MKIMKFGGSSVANGERIKNVAGIIQDEMKKGHVGVVLSAMKGVTNLLISASEKAEKGNKGFLKDLEEIESKHEEAVGYLFSADSGKSIKEKIKNQLHELRDVLHGVELIKECSKRSMDFIMSFGEKLSCQIMAAYLNSQKIESQFIDSSKVVRTDNTHGNASVNFEVSYSNIQEIFKSMKGIAVITGFIASTEDGITTTLGRNGSDYTAAIYGAGLNSEIIEIWTDVDGVLSSDPRVVKSAFVVPEISYEEAMELSYFGAEVIHPYTMIPAVDKNIPIVIKNTLNPSAPGTVIAKDVKRHNNVITGIACIDDVAIVNIEGGGMMGIPGMASRILDEIAKASINIIMISQASSEHSICLVMKQSEALKAKEVLESKLKDEIRHKMIHQISLRTDHIIIAVIGENMRGTPGISGKLFSSLGENEINIYAIAQGSSERNISVVALKKDKEKALTSLHKAFLE